MTVLVLPQALVDAVTRLHYDIERAAIEPGRGMVVQAQMPKAPPEMDCKKNNKHHSHLIEQHIRSTRKHRR